MKSSWITKLFAPVTACLAGVVIVGVLSAARGMEAGDAVAVTSQADAPQAGVRDMRVEAAVALRPAIVPDGALPAGAEAADERQMLEQAAGAQAGGDVPAWQWKPLEHSVTDLLRASLPGLPLLYQAVLQDDQEWLEDLLARGADPNEVTPGGDTALTAAIRLSQVESVQTLLFGGADPTLPGFEKQPPIAVASLRRGAEILAALLAAGADPNTRFSSPVTAAVLERVTVKDLRQTLDNDRGVTPLMCCAARGDVEGAIELLQAGAKTSLCTTRFKRYPINFAAVQNYLFLMRIILGRQPESEPEILVTINLSQQRAWLMKEGKIVDSCSVSTGRHGYATPAGRYVITDKHRSWTSTLYHVAMPYFMRLNCGAIGLHSGYVTGRPASHGCIRLPHAKAQKFFATVRVGDEVQIVH